MIEDLSKERLQQLANADSANPYSVLLLDNFSNKEVVTKRARLLLLELHPDKLMHKHRNLVEAAKVAVAKIINARNFLLDTGLKSKLDARLSSKRSNGSREHQEKIEEDEELFYKEIFKKSKEQWAKGQNKRIEEWKVFKKSS